MPDMQTKFRIILILLIALVSCNTQEDTLNRSKENPRSFSPEMQKDLLNLHHLQQYKAHKNSFVLGLEKFCNRPAVIGEYGRKTILEAEGAGSLRHIWETHGPGKSPFILEFYVDGESEPSIRGSLDELVEAAKACSQSYSPVGGSTIDYDSYNFYLPVPFERSLKVDLIANPSIGLVFIQLDYRLEDESMNGIKLVQKKDETGNLKFLYEPEQNLGTEVVTELPVTETSRWRFTGDNKISIDGPGIIRRLGINTQREGVKLLIRFNDEPSTAVNVDLADFFGPFRGVVLNNNQSFFPMPFSKSAEIEILGSHPDEEWQLEVDNEKIDKFEPHWGYFHAQHTKVDSSVGYLPFQVLSTRGNGHWVGMSLFDTHHDHGGADFAVIDANTIRPSFLHGDFGEDYFSFAFFGKGENFPYSEAFANDVGRMRVHFENPYPFNESIAISWGVTGGIAPRSVAFWYQDSPEDMSISEEEARGLQWSVFGPSTVKLLMEDGNTPDVSDLDQLFAVLPNEATLDAGRAIEVEHIMFSKEFKGTYYGWAQQYASGTYLNLMYAYGHVLSDLGSNHHIGYYARCMLARTYLQSSSNQEVTLQLSFDDPLQVFLNGTKIYSNAELNRGFVTHNFEANLIEGANKLLIKMLDTPNNNTMWAGLSLRILDKNGNSIN